MIVYWFHDRCNGILKVEDIVQLFDRRNEPSSRTQELHRFSKNCPLPKHKTSNIVYEVKPRYARAKRLLKLLMS